MTQRGIRGLETDVAPAGGLISLCERFACNSARLSEWPGLPSASPTELLLLAPLASEALHARRAGWLADGRMKYEGLFGRVGQLAWLLLLRPPLLEARLGTLALKGRLTRGRVGVAAVVSVAPPRCGVAECGRGFAAADGGETFPESWLSRLRSISTSAADGGSGSGSDAVGGGSGGGSGNVWSSCQGAPAGLSR